MLVLRLALPINARRGINQQGIIQTHKQIVMENSTIDTTISGCYPSTIFSSWNHCVVSRSYLLYINNIVKNKNISCMILDLRFLVSGINCFISHMLMIAIVTIMDTMISIVQLFRRVHIARNIVKSFKHVPIGSQRFVG